MEGDNRRGRRGVGKDDVERAESAEGGWDLPPGHCVSPLFHGVSSQPPA